MTRPTNPPPAPPGWTVIQHRRTLNHRRLAITAAATVCAAVGLLVAVHAQRLAVPAAGIVLGVLAAGWHLYLARPIHVIHATPPTATTKGGPDAEHSDPATAAHR